MAILRAGPWGELGDEFQDPVQALVNGPDFTQLSSSSEDYLPAPVNCAKGNWTNQDWGAVYVLNDFTDEHIITRGIVGLNENVKVDFIIFANIVIGFCWQATEDFDINLNWSVTGSVSIFPSLAWQYSTIQGSDDSFFDTPTNSGTETVTLPATTFGQFSFYISGFAYDESEIIASIS